MDKRTGIRFNPCQKSGRVCIFRKNDFAIGLRRAAGLCNLRDEFVTLANGT